MVHDGRGTGRSADPARRTTIADVAALSGTSKGTVSFVLNNKPGVADATRRRVLSAIEELEWRPSRLARSLSNSRADAIGLVLARTAETLRADSFFAPFLAGVEQSVAQADMSVLLRFVSTEEIELEAYQSLVRGGRVDGVIVADLRPGDPRIDLLRELGAPAVSLNRPDVPSPFPAVVNDDVAGIEAAVDHLVGLGHSRIAQVSGPHRYLHTRRRRTAFSAALSGHGVRSGATVEADFTAHAAASATRRLLEVPPEVRPTAIVFDNDIMAVAGTVVAQHLGLSVPGDLSVVGFDDVELSAFVSPPLTTVRTDPFTWGLTAARQLLAVVHGVEDVQDVVLDAPELVVRGSTSAPSRQLAVTGR